MLILSCLSEVCNTYFLKYKAKNKKNSGEKDKKSGKNYSGKK
jgi:hypothetical protein